MVVFAPTIDFTQILDEMGQSVVLRKITRTVDTNGNVTNVTETDSDITALVQEVGWKEKPYVELGIVNIGDIQFFVAPDTDVTVYDKLVWNNDIYSIRKILKPPMIAQTRLFLQILTVRDA